MAEKPIGVGDLVMVVRCCCVWAVAGRPIFKVVEIDPGINENGDLWQCEGCGKLMPPEPHAESDTTMHPVSWLKRIPPLEELDEVRQSDEVAA